MHVSYIELLNRFWQLDDEVQGLSGNQTRLYFYLLKIANKAGWPDEFEYADAKLLGNVGMKAATLRPCRERLVEVGLLSYTPGGQGQGNKVRYQLRYQKFTPKPADSYQKFTPKEGVRYQIFTPNEGLSYQFLTPNLIPKNALVSIKVSNFDTYSIYKRLKTFTIALRPSLVSKFDTYVRGKQNPPPSGAPSRPADYQGDPFFIKRDSEQLNVPFSDWFAAYGLDVGETESRRLWAGLTDAERLRAKEHTIPYVRVTPKRWRKSPPNYLDQKKFLEKDIISREDNTKSKPESGSPQREVIRTEYEQQSFRRSRNTGSNDTGSGHSNAA